MACDLNISKIAKGPQSIQNLEKTENEELSIDDKISNLFSPQFTTNEQGRGAEG